MKRIVSMFLLTLATCFSIYTHPGRTDSNGGHFDKSTGEYHYHHGYPEHQHTNGVCPYDYDDKTDHSSSSSGSGTAKITKENLTPTPTPKIDKSSKKEETGKSKISSIVDFIYKLTIVLTVIFFAFVFACCLVAELIIKPLRELIQKIKSKKR